MIAIKIADQANPKSDVVQVIAVHVTAVDLTPPAVAHFDLAVPSGRAVSNDEVIGQAILHVTNVSMIVIEHAGVTLTRATVMHHNHLPAGVAPISRRPINFRAD